MNLYVLISDAGDGSYYPHYCIDESVIARLTDAYEKDELDFEYAIGMDGDGFHYDTLNLPDDLNPKTLGISSFITHKDVDGMLNV